MRYRSRLAAVSSAGIGCAIAAASLASFLTVRADLESGLEQTLASTAATDLALVSAGPAASAASRADAQLVSADGSITHLGAAGLTLPLVSRAEAVAGGSARPFLSEVSVGDTRLLVDTTTAGPGRAIQVALSLDAVDTTLGHLARVLLVVTGSGLALAAVAGLLAARTLLSPLRRLGTTAAQVAATRDLSRRLEVSANDELGRIASSFNDMMSALEQSLRTQRQLVADASHELRTPLTSLRTNMEVLTRADGLSPSDREALTADLLAQLEELSVLVGDLADLARESGPAPALDEVSLDAVVAEAVERAQRRAPQLDFQADLVPVEVRGDPSSLARAVTNLLDNAAKWGPAGTTVEVGLRTAAGVAEVTVRDRGPGIPPGDLPFVFERFYRAGGDRRLPGSGLGLAIVRQVAEWHGGSVTAAAAEGGGAILRLRLPAT